MRHHLLRRLDRLALRIPPKLPPLPEVDPEWQELARRDPKANEMAVELFRYRQQHWPDREPTSEESRADRAYLLLQFRLEAWEAGGVDVLFARMLERRRGQTAEGQL